MTNTANELCVRREVAISASAERVWRVLTDPELNREWSSEFGGSGPIEAEWRVGGAVRWRNARGDVYVSGRVLSAEPARLLRFSVRDVDPRMQPASGAAEDDIVQSYALAEANGTTLLATSHGDFAKLANGAALVPLVGPIWDRLLGRLKALAER